MPLLDGTSPFKTLEKGKKQFALPAFGRDINKLYQFLLEGECPVSRIMAIYCIQEEGLEDQYRDAIYILTQNHNPILRQEALRVINNPKNQTSKEDDTAETMYLIIDGELSLLKKDKQLPGRVFGTGETIGEAGLLLNEVRLLTLIAETESTLLVIHKQEFLEIVREYPHISLEIAISMAGQAQELLEQFVEEEDSPKNSS